MKIISWNVNSIRARVEGFLEVAERENPDVFLLQETRIDDPQFPREYFEDLEYNVAIKGEKGRNGVAIFSKHALEEARCDFSEEARYIEAFTGGIFVASVYVPNGREVEAPAYFYKEERNNRRLFKKSREKLKLEAYLVTALPTGSLYRFNLERIANC